MRRIIKIFTTTTISTLFIIGITLFAITNADPGVTLSPCPVNNYNYNYNNYQTNNGTSCVLGQVWCPSSNAYINYGSYCNPYIYCSANNQYYVNQSDYNNYCNTYRQYCQYNNQYYYSTTDYSLNCKSNSYSNVYNNVWCQYTNSYIPSNQSCNNPCVYNTTNTYWNGTNCINNNVWCQYTNSYMTPSQYSNSCVNPCNSNQYWGGSSCIDNYVWCPGSSSLIKRWDFCPNTTNPTIINIPSNPYNNYNNGYNLYNNNPYNYNQSNTTSILPNYNINNNVITPNAVNSYSNYNNYSDNSNSIPSYSLSTQFDAYSDTSDEYTSDDIIYSAPVVISYVPASNYKNKDNKKEHKDRYDSYTSADTSIKLQTANKNKVALSINGKSLTQDVDNKSSTGSNPIIVGGPTQYQGQIPPPSNNMGGGQLNYPQMTGYTKTSNSMSNSFTPNTILQWVGFVLMLIVLFLLGDYVYNKKKRLG